MEENNILPLAPCRVKIIKCSGEQFWYKNLIGEEFGVDNASGVRDFVLWEDYVNKRTMWRHIAQQDCEVVNREPSYGFRPNVHIPDELESIVVRYTPEQLHEMYRGIIPILYKDGEDKTNHLFPVSEMNKRIEYLKANPPRYVIGVDTYDKGNYAYCLMVEDGNDRRVVLANTRHNEDDFNEEVANLAKYFNAESVWEETPEGVENIRKWVENHSYDKIKDLLKESRDLLVMCSLIDKSNQCETQVNKIDKIMKWDK